MSVGESGRVVIEMAPEMKRELHAMLSRDGQTLKSWFVMRAAEYIRSSRQLPMFVEIHENVVKMPDSNKG